MRLHSTVAALALTAAAALPAAAQQTAPSVTLTPFVTYYRSEGVGSPTLAGGELALWAGQFGGRGSLALPLTGPTNADGARGWDGDLDLVVRLGDVTRSDIAFVPYAFAGMGGRTRPDALRNDVWTPTRSYGAGATLSLSRALAISGEARMRRYRNAYDGSWDSDNTPEWRFGVVLRAK